jgi:hypothetical protein
MSCAIKSCDIESQLPYCLLSSLARIITCDSHPGIPFGGRALLLALI